MSNLINETFQKHLNSLKKHLNEKKSKLLLEINFTVPEAIEVLKRYGVSDAGNMSSDELKKSYRKLVSKYHPDVGGSKEDFINIDSAYDTLNNRSRSTNQQPSSSNSSSQKRHPYHDEIQKEIEQYKLFKEEQEKEYRLFKEEQEKEYKLFTEDKERKIKEYKLYMEHLIEQGRLYKEYQIEQGRLYKEQQLKRYKQYIEDKYNVHIKNL